MFSHIFFIPLDIFRANHHNKNISNKLDAWLLFFSSDDPEDIIYLCKEYPEFQAMYEQAYAMCRNLENVMGIFSEELKILDQNTVQLMIDDMQDTINFQKDALSKKDAVIDQMRKEIERLKAAHAAD